MIGNAVRLKLATEESMAKIVEAWGTIYASQLRRYDPPEMQKYAFVGTVDGAEVTLPVDKIRDGKFVSAGVEYELGEPHPEYEALYPGARERVLARISELAKRE